MPDTSVITERLAMTALKSEEIRGFVSTPADCGAEFSDLSIQCIDCSQGFIWTAGEQAFFRDKQLENPPKRCKDCKKAKNRRLEAIEIARTTGRRQRIEVRAECARCSLVTTVPFYPCQGRPVYCRDCFADIGIDPVKVTNGHL